jgi:DNA-directed RNA polymerase specialized sigma24 family protein
MTATSDPPDTIEALLADHGQAIGSFAYLVLQHQTDAERILGATLATALGRADLPPDPGALRAQLLRIAARGILRGSAQTGEVAPILPDPRSSVDRMPLLEALAELDPHARMAVVLSYYLDLPSDVVAGILEDDGFALRSDLNDARNRLQFRVDEQRSSADAEPVAGAPAPSGSQEPFDARLRRALMEESARYRPTLESRELHLPAPRGEGIPRIARRWWPLAVGALLVVGATGFLWLARTPVPAGSRLAAPSLAAAQPPRTAAEPITLADCQIAPADSPLAFAGWTTLAALAVHGGDAGLGQPIYALITRGMAEWVGWQEHYTGPMYPAPVGRMGCIFDPSTRSTSLVGVDTDWQPALMADGCPPSPIDEFGGYRELGGPHAWLLLPGDTSTWGVGQDNSILFRLSPPAEPGQSITARAQPLADAPSVLVQIDSANSQHGLSDPSGSGSRYYLMNVRFTKAGCWVINVALNGQVVGSAIAPITPSPLARALPRRQGSR